MAEEVKVRLSAEGQREVLAALKRLQDEAAKTSKVSAGAMGAMSSQVAGLLRVLPGLAAVATAAGITQLISNTVNAADELEKMSQKIGINVESLAELQHGAKLAGVEKEALAQSIKKLNVNMADAARGVGEGKAAFDALGISVKNADGTLKSSDQVLAEIADKFQRMQDGAGKTALAVKLFGRAGADLIPLLNQGSEGLRKNAEEARALGLVFSGELTKKAEELNDNLTRLKGALEGAARSFVTPMIPAVNEFIAVIVEAQKQVGVFLGLMGRIALSAKDLENPAAGLTEISRKLDEVTKKRADFEKMGPVLRFFSADDIAILDTQIKMFGAQKAALEALLKVREQPDNFELMGVPRSPAPALPGPVDKSGENAAHKAAQARINFLKAQLDTELRIFQANQKLVESEDKAAFDRGLLTLQQFHDRRRAMLLAEFDKELEILQKKRDITATGPTRDQADVERRNAELERLDADIQVKRIERQRAAGEATDAQIAAEKQLADQRFQFEQRALEAQGKRSEAALRALDQEIQKYAEILRLQGLTDSEIAARTGQFRDTVTRNINFDEVRAKASQALAELSTARERVNQQVQQGQAFVFQGEQQIIELEKQRLPVLQALSAEMTRLAQESGEALKIQEAREFASAIGAVQVSINQAGREMADFKAQAFDALVNNTTEFLTTGLAEAKSFGDAIKGLARGIFQDLQRMAAQALSKQIWQFLLGAIGGAAAGAAGAGAGAAAGSGPVITGGGGTAFAAMGGFVEHGRILRRMVDGGMVTGPGTATSDSIPARLSDGEYVVRSAAVKRVGVDLLDAINRGRRSLSIVPINRYSGAQHFADGGLVSGGAGSMESSFTGTLGLEEGLVLRHLESSAGQRAIINILQKNKRTARNVLG